MKGRIVQSTGSWYEVAVDQNGKQKIVNCRLPGRFRLNEQQQTNPVAVGDRVQIEFNEDDTGTIVEIEERDNFIIRQSTHKKQEAQILVANVDQAFTVQSIRKPRLKQGFIDRFLVTCEAYDITPALIINKKDLATKKDRQTLQHLNSLYESLKYPVLITSIHDPKTLHPLKKKLVDKTSVFVGPSGAGKTSLLNAIDPEIERKVGKISDYSEKGRHTTTYSKLLPLSIGGYLVDTPGIREFGLVDIEDWELSLFFPEMLEPRQHCKFNNCTHSHEPGCGVMEAFEKGEIDPVRYQSYLSMLESLN